MRISKIFISLIVFCSLLFLTAGCTQILPPKKEAENVEPETPYISPEASHVTPVPIYPPIMQEPPQRTPEEPKEEPTEEPNEVSEYFVKYVRSKVNGLNIRVAPSASGASLGHIDCGDMVLYNGSENGWYATYYRGKEAYVSALEQYTEIVSLEKGNERVEKVIETATKLLGTPYVYGATRLHDGKGNLLKGFTDDAFDCSSFVQYAYYYGADILLDVTTRTQAIQGKEVAPNQLKRGDLMYFTNASRLDKKDIERIGHVAVYLGGDYVLHTASDYAVIEKLTATRRNYLITIRRHIDY